MRVVPPAIVCRPGTIHRWSCLRRNVVPDRMNLRATFTKTHPAFQKTSTGIEVKAMRWHWGTAPAPGAVIGALADDTSGGLFRTPELFGEGAEHNARGARGPLPV